jgi:ribosome-associated protein
MGSEGLHLGRGRFIPASELRERTSLSGGPGGQHANKTSSRITLSWNLRSSEALSSALKARLEIKLSNRLSSEGEIQVHVDAHRSQHRNREEARLRLTTLITEALKVEKPRRATQPSRAAKARRMDSKRKRSDTKRSRQHPNRED